MTPPPALPTLGEAEWQRVRPFLPPVPPRDPRGRSRLPDRLILDAVHYVLVHRIPWRDLPLAYGPYSTMFSRFRDLAQAGFFAKAWPDLWNDYQLREGPRRS